jgi:ketosteroid isomerase-like protein
VPTGPTPAQDNAAIRQVLQQFVDGYKALSLESIRRVFPAATANFKDARAYEVELLDLQIALQGNRATVTCRRAVRQTGRSGRPNESVIPTVFGMRRDPAGWIIEEVH